MATRGAKPGAAGGGWVVVGGWQVCWWGGAAGLFLPVVCDGGPSPGDWAGGAPGCVGRDGSGGCGCEWGWGGVWDIAGFVEVGDGVDDGGLVPGGGGEHGGGMEWLTLLCLPRTLRASLWFLTASLCLSMARSPGLSNLSLRSRLANTGASGGGWVWWSGLTYPTPGPPTLSSISSSESSTTRRCSSSSTLVRPQRAPGILPRTVHHRLQTLACPAFRCHCSQEHPTGRGRWSGPRLSVC